MSPPKRGMVAGKPITTEAVTKEYEDGHARTFGTPTGRKGGRWVFDEKAGKMVPFEDYRRPGEARLEISTDRHYENTATVDGTDIGSRRKREEYMRVHGVTDPRDFTQHWNKSAADRAE